MCTNGAQEAKPKRAKKSKGEFIQELSNVNHERSVSISLRPAHFSPVPLPLPLLLVPECTTSRHVTRPAIIAARVRAPLPRHPLSLLVA